MGSRANEVCSMPQNLYFQKAIFTSFQRQDRPETLNIIYVKKQKNNSQSFV
jgi:hypothetical protein